MKAGLSLTMKYWDYVKEIFSNKYWKMDEVYRIEVKKENINKFWKILRIIKDNELLNVVEIMAGHEILDEYEIDEIINTVPDYKCVVCQSNRQINTCNVCKRVFCENDYIFCKFCRNPVCFSDITLSFKYNHSTGDDICKFCN